MPAEATKVVFPVSIYDAARRGQSFGQVRTATSGSSTASAASSSPATTLPEDASTETAMVFGELYRTAPDWKFRAVGQGWDSGLRGIATEYGVNVG